MNPPPPVPPKKNPHDIGQDGGIRMLLPVGRSGWAIAAGYLGLFAVLLVPAPLALITGIIALRDISTSLSTPRPKHGMGRAWFGIIMGTIFTLLLIPMILALLSR